MPSARAEAWPQTLLILPCSIILSRIVLDKSVVQRNYLGLLRAQAAPVRQNGENAMQGHWDGGGKMGTGGVKVKGRWWSRGKETVACCKE